MQFSISLIAAVAAFLPVTQAHLYMDTPKPYNSDTNNSPMNPDGSNFPCKLNPGAVFQSPRTEDVYIPGQVNDFIIVGGATHGGGSCQVSITYDNPPTKNSVFKVVQSYVGNCPFDNPGNRGSDAGSALPPLPVTLPVGLKAGVAVFAWTWFNKVGNREMYMNCAPITIGGDGNDDTLFNSLPDMFVANINVPQSSCTTKESFDIVFPNPGQNVVVGTNGVNFGPACEGGPSNPGGDGAPAPAPSSSAPPSVTTRPILIQDPISSTTSVGNSFSEIAGPSTTLAVSTTPRATATTTTANAPTPTAPGNNNGTDGDFVGGSCDPSKGIIICHSDPTVYSQCYDNNLLYGPFAVPPGTVCDSTGMGGFKAVTVVSRRSVRRNLARKHRRSYGHRHSF